MGRLGSQNRLSMTEITIENLAGEGAIWDFPLDLCLYFVFNTVTCEERVMNAEGGVA